MRATADARSAGCTMQHEYEWRTMLDLTPPRDSLEPIEIASRDEIAALQLGRLKATLRHVYDNVPHYWKAFDAAGVHPDDLQSLDDLAKFPFTTKADLRANYPFGMFAVPQEEIVRVHASSGTTGKPTVVGYSKRDIDTWSDLMARSIRASGGRRGMIVHVAYGYGLFTGGLGAHYGSERLGCVTVPVSGGMTERQVQLITDFKPDIIMVTPSYMLAISTSSASKASTRARSSLKVGIFGAEPWTNAMRSEIEQAFDMHAVDIYGLSRGDGPRRRQRVRGDQGRPAHLGGPLLSGDHRPRDRHACCPTARPANSCSRR